MGKNCKSWLVTDRLQATFFLPMITCSAWMFPPLYFSGVSVHRPASFQLYLRHYFNYLNISFCHKGKDAYGRKDTMEIGPIAHICLSGPFHLQTWCKMTWICWHPAHVARSPSTPHPHFFVTFGGGGIYREGRNLGWNGVFVCALSYSG